MRAIRISAFSDGLDHLKIENLPDLALSPGEAKVRVRAACINPSDVKNVQGKMEGTTLPRVPGRDFAGIVAAQRDDTFVRGWPVRTVEHFETRIVSRCA